LAQDAYARGEYAHGAFLAQQAAEKWVKAAWLRKGSELPRTHNVDDLCDGLGAPPEVVAAGRMATRPYTAARYPDVLGGPAYRLIRLADADQAMEAAEEVHQWVKDQLLE